MFQEKLLMKDQILALVLFKLACSNFKAGTVELNAANFQDFAKKDRKTLNSMALIKTSTGNWPGCLSIDLSASKAQRIPNHKDIRECHGKSCESW